MSIILGGGGGYATIRKWATLATLLIMGVVLIFILSSLGKIFLWFYTMYLNTTYEIRAAFAEVMEEELEYQTIEVKSEFGNYSALIAKPTNAPFNSTLWDFLVWGIELFTKMLAEPMVWAALLGLSLVLLALELKD